MSRGCSDRFDELWIRGADFLFYFDDGPINFPPLLIASSKVNAIDFFVFLSACGSEFEEVYREQQKMSKPERLKWAARRLSNVNRMGENGVRILERRLERGPSSAGIGLKHRMTRQTEPIRYTSQGETIHEQDSSGSDGGEEYP